MVQVNDNNIEHKRDYPKIKRKDLWEFNRIIIMGFGPIWHNFKEKYPKQHKAENWPSLAEE